MTTSLNIGQVLRDCADRLRDGMGVYAVLVASFVLLPQLAATLFGPKLPETPEKILALLTHSPIAVMLPVLIPAVIAFLADLAVARLVIDTHDRRDTSVGAALLGALRGLPVLLLALGVLLLAMTPLAFLLSPLPPQWMVALILLPMLYLTGRLVPLVPLVSTGLIGPMMNLRRCWAIGDGHGWWLLGFALGARLAMAMAIGIASIVGGALGTVLTSFGLAGVGMFMAALVPAIAAALAAATYAVASASIYLQLRDKP